MTLSITQKQAKISKISHETASAGNPVPSISHLAALFSSLVLRSSSLLICTENGSGGSSQESHEDCFKQEQQLFHPPPKKIQW